MRTYTTAAVAEYLHSGSEVLTTIEKKEKEKKNKQNKLVTEV